jgi:S1-C subfamily serine protease
MDFDQESDESTRPAWLLGDPIVHDEPPVTTSYEPLPSMVIPTPPTTAPKAKTGRAVLLGALAGAVVAALVSGAIVTIHDRNDDKTSSGSSGNQPAPVIVSNGDSLDVHAVLAAVQDAVVAINVDIESQGPFGSQSGRAAGTGMVIEADGLILTNNHVVENATSITVTLADGSEVDADLVGSIPSNDIALVRARDVHDLTTVTFGSSSAARVGDPVVAIGNALGLGGTPSTTAGIVSALGRELDAENGEHLEELIQTDAAIYPGNSGGPLVNASGQVIGVNTAIARGPEGIGSENLGFALPIDQLKPLIDELKQGGGEVRGGAFLGVRTVDIGDVTPAVLDRFNITADHGALVGEVIAGSAADDAGLQVGDVITAIDGHQIETAAGVGEVITGAKPGDEVTLTVERDGKERTITATLGSRGVTG